MGGPNPTSQALDGSDALQSRLLDEAIDLLIRRQSGPDNPVTLRTITVWRARSSAHEAIWQKVTKAHGISGLALQSQSGKAEGLTRRNLMLGGLAVVGGGALAAWGGSSLRVRMLADHVTTTAELLPLSLPDGSKITLGPDSAIVSPSIQSPREVRLLRGMAWLSVAPDAARPFTLRLAAFEARTTGADFEISEEAGIVSLGTARDSVEVVAPMQQRLAEGSWLRLDLGSGQFAAGRRDPAMAGLWQSGMILAEAEPLETLVARIARWLPGRVVVADSKIGHARISGLFDITNPEAALEAAVQPTGGRLRRVPGLLTVISAV